MSHPILPALVLCLTMAAGAAAADPAPRTLGVPCDPKAPDVQAQGQALKAAAPKPPPAGKHPPVDASGVRQQGKASVYAGRFSGRHMTDGNRFHPGAQAAASRTLPLGTVAKVTNTETGRTALIRVEDRGPFVDGRTVDVPPSTAREIGLTHKDGTAPVVVAPVAVPQGDGTVKPGAGVVRGPATGR